MKIKTWKYLALFALLPASGALAHAGHGPSDEAYRTWTDKSRSFSLEAAFVLERHGTVLLRKPDEALVSVDLKDLDDAGRSWVAQRVAGIQALNASAPVASSAPATAPAGKGEIPIPVRFFESFVPHVSVRWDEKNLIVESDGMAEHPMMVGIRAWNQQVPLPQAYRGDNAFRIPLHPEKAAQSTPAPYLNAIAVAVNGVPIFHPIKQDGRTDTVTNGELDEYGGHAGRGDDYHYHIAPRHLERIVGEGNPVAYSLDGYPIVVAKEVGGKPTVTLDENHGCLDAVGNYSYYSTTTFPYLNISYRGVIDLEARPRAVGIRPYTQPLPGARITGFEKTDEHNYRLTYEVGSARNVIAYTVLENGGAQFNFINSDKSTRSETYSESSNKGRGGERNGGRDGRDPEKGPRPDKGPESGPRHGEAPGQGGPRPEGGPEKAPDGAPRQPWILAHAAELDMNRDGAISRTELTDEVNRAFDGYDADRNGTLSAAELGGRSNVRSAMGGFIKGHAKEVDQNGDTGLTRTELLAVATRMFDRMDSDGDGTASAAELQASHRGPGEEPRGKGADKGERPRPRKGE